MLGHLDMETRLQPHSHRLREDIGVEPAQHALLTETLQPLMGAG